MGDAGGGSTGSPRVYILHLFGALAASDSGFGTSTRSTSTSRSGYSVVTRARPNVPNSSSAQSSLPTTPIDTREPLTTSLGLPILYLVYALHWWGQPTVSFFPTAGSTKKVLLLATVSPTLSLCRTRARTSPFEHKNKNQRCHNVTLFGNAGFAKYPESIQAKIGAKASIRRDVLVRLKGWPGSRTRGARRPRTRWTWRREGDESAQSGRFDSELGV
ncbi:uncharacterized protein EI90DRAFT_3020770 [Cantharellus anzutake]|uniref:uncharacterized protein n=1 Tax=Cantharellus anzutake TaxID=1750568 RepID=UPI0019040DAF|nr:uncharacterized protein EI90DRAFT_3020770 [Cantharellus anzutake]KAF8319470.1 hypothetical protein EI90DRAFT_3020770 [Cantharellus anzutake]